MGICLVQERLKSLPYRVTMVMCERIGFADLFLCRGGSSPLVHGKIRPIRWAIMAKPCRVYLENHQKTVMLGILPVQKKII